MRIRVEGIMTAKTRGILKFFCIRSGTEKTPYGVIPTAGKQRKNSTFSRVIIEMGIEEAVKAVNNSFG